MVLGLGTRAHGRDWGHWDGLVEGQACGKVSDGLFPLALQTDAERQPEGWRCRTRAPADRNPNLSGTWAGQQTSVELATNLIQEANSLSLHGLDDIYAKMVLVSLFLSTTALFCNFCFILDSEARVQSQHLLPAGLLLGLCVRSAAAAQ